MRRPEHAVAGEGVPFVPGIDPPHAHVKWMTDRKLALVAQKRQNELAAARRLNVIFSGMERRMQLNERAAS